MMLIQNRCRKVCLVLLALSLPILSLNGCATVNDNLHQQQRLLEQAYQWYQQGDLMSAEQVLNRLHRAQLDSQQSWRLLGNIHFRQQRLEAAEQAYRHALEQDDQDALSWHNLALVRLRQTTATLLSARAQLNHLSNNDEQLLDMLMRLQRNDFN